MSVEERCEWCGKRARHEETMTVWWQVREEVYKITYWCHVCADQAMALGVTTMLRTRKEALKLEG